MNFIFCFGISVLIDNYAKKKLRFQQIINILIKNYNLLLLGFQFPILIERLLFLNKHMSINEMSLQYSQMNYNSGKRKTIGELISQNCEIKNENNYISFYVNSVYYMVNKW